MSIILTIAAPTAGLMKAGGRFANSLTAMTSYLAANGLKSRPGPLTMRMDWQESTSIHTNREMIVKRACESDSTHLLFLDDDMTFQPNVLDILFSRFQPVVVVNYLIKTDNPQFVAVGLDGKRIPTREQDTGIVPIAYSGFGVSLFDIDVWRKTPQPWFLPKFNAETSSYSTEDSPAYEKIREAGFTVFLDQDASLLVGHCGIKEWTWRDWKGDPEEK